MAKRHDGWTNVITSLGTSRDKRLSARPDSFIKIEDQELSSAYLTDGLSKIIVDTFPDDMIREWITLTGMDSTEEEKEDIYEDLKRLKAPTNYNKALKWQRLYGGSLILIGAMDGKDLDQPLKPESIKSIDWLRVIERPNIDIWQSVFVTDPMSPDFGKVEKYHVEFRIGSTYNWKKIHHSRVVAFFGEPVPEPGVVAQPLPVLDLRLTVNLGGVQAVALRVIIVPVDAAVRSHHIERPARLEPGDQLEVELVIPPVERRVARETEVLATVGRSRSTVAEYRQSHIGIVILQTQH